VIEFLEEKRVEIGSLLDKVLSHSVDIESFSSKETTQLRELIGSTDLVNVSSTVKILEEKRVEIGSLLDNVLSHSVDFESLSTEETTQLRELIGITDLTNVSSVIEVLEEKQVEIGSLLDKVLSRSVDIESLNAEETTQLWDLVNVVHVDTANSVFQSGEPISVENLIGRAIDRSKHVDRTISTLKNISTLSNATINRINKFERTQKSIKVLVAGDFPNYLRETPLQYYTIIPPQRLENTMLVSNQIGASTSIQSNMSHKVESVKPNDNEEKHENINNLLHKLEEQSKKIESLEKSANANRSYSLSQSDINAITDDLLYKLENQSTIENFRKGIF
jgi:hypothetical protein